MKQIFKFTSIRTLIALYFLLAFSGAMLVYVAVVTNSIIHEQSYNYNNHFRYHIANDCFRQGTDLLTEAVRRYVVTMKPEYIEQYFAEALQIRHREQALEMVRDLQIDPELKESLNQAMETSRKLMDTEYHAMHLIALRSKNETLHREVKDYPLTPKEEKMSIIQRHVQAEKLLWDDAYIRNKAEIYEYLSRGLETANEQSMERHQQLKGELIRMLYLGSICLIAFVLAVCGFVFYRRYQHEQVILLQAEKNAEMNVLLKEERDKAIRAEKARSYFFSTVSHDIRTPLNSVIGFSEMLQLGIEDPEEKEKALDAIITSSQTLLELINDVLDLSKLESGKMELHPVPTDVAELVRKVTSSFEVAASRLSVQLYSKVEEMPALQLDPQRIRQILFNLIGNAVKFTVKGYITVRAAYDENGTFTLSVSDTGRGISQEDIGKLMSPYVQLRDRDSTTGTGLGLAICKQLSKQMQGELELESELGKGSTFTLRIPNVKSFSKEEADAYFHKNNAPKVVTKLDEVFTEKSILIVDDQKLNLRILQTMLARLGLHKVLTAGNGKEALDVLRNADKVDLVLTDMSMPVMDGAELVREIRKQPRFEKLPVYVITADVEMQGEYRKIGFDDMLIKPITLEKLRALLTNSGEDKENA
ncbi:MAG: response regulator [Lentisphaeria bacterium]|nr:response regulator [Lentisphaeria bacterium]